MERYENFKAFMNQYNNKSFNSKNIPQILENLEKADREGCLKLFFINEGPYKSAFPFSTNLAWRNRDQVATVFALNLYGMHHPGFAFRLNVVLKELACGSTKEKLAVFVIRNAQIELQRMNISLIDFFDKELLELVNSSLSQIRTLKIILMLVFIHAGACSAPLFAMAGIIFLIPVSSLLMLYGIYKISFWISIKPLSAEAINNSARYVRDYHVENQNKSNNQRSASDTPKYFFPF